MIFKKELVSWHEINSWKKQFDASLQRNAAKFSRRLCLVPELKRNKEEKNRDS